jgi:FkbM family methyltransferase
VKVKPEEVLEGFNYYLKSLLFVRPVKRVFTRFIKKVLMRRPYEFRSWNVFMVHNLDVRILLVDASRYYDYTRRYRGEEKIIKLLRCLLGVLRHGVFIDVGSYVGFYTLLAAKYGWRAIAFEPNPLNLILLRYNIDLHDINDKVVVIDKAAGSVQGSAIFTLSYSPSESSFTKYLRNELKLFNIVVEVTSIDSVVESLNIKDDSIIIIKIDVEGFGLEVVKGAIKTIERFRPFIVFEVHRTFDEQDEINVLKMLKRLGYGLKIIEPRSERNFIIFISKRKEVSTL